MIKNIMLIISILRGGNNTMVDVYVALIVAHRRTIEQVPIQLRPAVLAELTALGLDGNGNLLPTEPLQ